MKYIHRKLNNLIGRFEQIIVQLYIHTHIHTHSKKRQLTLVIHTHTHTHIHNVHTDYVPPDMWSCVSALSLGGPRAGHVVW